MTLTFQRLCDEGVLGPIHRAFGELLRRLDPEAHPHVLLAGVVASEQLSRGHVCLDLKAAEHITFANDDSGENARAYSGWPKAASWSKELQHSGLVMPLTAFDDGSSITRPLVFDAEQQRVYLARYWFLQQQLAGWIADRVKSRPITLDRQQLAVDVAKLFPQREQESDRDQFGAVLNAADRRFAVITGGPGTGKTTTVAKLLAARLLQSAGQGEGRELRIALMAPTGKAAQRLNESLARAAINLPGDIVSDGIRQQLQSVTAGTIHRLLEWTPQPPERGGPFRRGPQHPLEADIVLVDEASMVDIELMWHLFAALRSETQIILMGDRDQLASVEAGGVLSDLCGTPTFAAAASHRAEAVAIPTGPSPSVTKARPAKKRAALTKLLFAEDESLPNSVSWLRFSHRFPNESEFGQLAAAIRGGDADTAIALFKNSKSGRLNWISVESSDAALRQLVEQAAGRFRGYLDALYEASNSGGDEGKWNRVLQQLASVRVLCAHRDGNSGERAMNQRLAQFFANHNLLRPRVGAYVGQAVIITENDYRQNLFNGDVGVVVPANKGLAVAFEDATKPTGGVRLVPSALAPAHRDSWAMTIHKSQGSEFRSVFVVLPEFESPVLSRELLYTAVTRVKESSGSDKGAGNSGFLSLVAREEVLRAAITREIRRTSGLRDAINARLEVR